MIEKILREDTALLPDDCITIFSREKNSFDFPLHYHREMELNLILNAEGAKRIIGDHIGTISDIELVLIGPDLPHGWFNSVCSSKVIREVTIQFDSTFLTEGLLCRNQLSKIKDMLNRANKGILFSKDTATKLMTKIFEISGKGQFSLVLDLLSILHQLSLSTGQQRLSDSSFTETQINYHSRRIERVMNYINQHFHQQISLVEVSRIANMEPGSFSHFIRKRTGMTFVDLLNEVRLGHVSRMLIETDHSIAEIAFKCGYNNMANFNRTFKSKKGCTPVDLRRNYQENRGVQPIHVTLQTAECPIQGKY